MTDGLSSQNDELVSKPSLLNWGTAVVDYPRIRKKPQYCEVRLVFKVTRCQRPLECDSEIFVDVENFFWLSY